MIQSAGIADFCILFAFAVIVNYIEAAQTLHELCKAKNKPLHTLEDNGSELVVINSTMDLKARKLAYPRQKNRCHLEYKVCPSCHFEVVIKNMTISPCSLPECWCGFFEIDEALPQYKRTYCGNYSTSEFYFESKTRHIFLDFVQNGNFFYVVLNITSRRNQYTITGMPTSEHVIESPFFPDHYPPDYSAEYTFHSLDPKGHVQLLFLDFQLLSKSYIEVSGHNGYRIDTYDGDVFRPPPLTSQGMQLRLKFEANSRHVTKAGFRAICTFVRSDWNFLLETPNVNCGGSREGYGGTVSINIPDTVGQLVDCIWLIYPPLFAERNLFSAVIAESKNIGTGSVLELRKGLTSVSSVIKQLECHSSDCFTNAEKQEITVSASVGIYIRFRGHITKDSSMIISYCTFREKDCTDNEFVCVNGRCLHKFLHCDGFNHCGDNSDEENCEVEKTTTTTTQKTTLVTQMPNIVKEELPAGITSLILITAIFGLSIVILGVIVIINKWYKPRPLRRESRQPQLILGTQSEATELPSCHSMDNPPSYEDVLRNSRRYPRLSYSSQNDAETSCSFVDFQQASSEILHTTYENCPSGSPQNSELFKNNTTVFKNASLGSISDAEASHPESVPSSHSDASSFESASIKCKLEFPETSGSPCQSTSSKSGHFCHHRRPRSCPRIHVVEQEHVLLQPVPHKHPRCMTLPPDYKMPQQRSRAGSDPTTCGASKSMLESKDHFPCSSNTVTETPLPRYTCTVITSFPTVINAEILPLVRNRCSSDSHRVTVVDLHSFFRKKDSTF